jgi:hypothetical protein
MYFDKSFDVGLKLSGGTMNAALQLLACQLRKPSLDLINSGCGRWCEVNMPMRTAC